MRNDSSIDNTANTIRINSELYNSLRDYCDKKNIRFVDFVEDSLENAISFHEQSNLVEENKQILSEIKDKHEKIYNSGFNEGFYIAFYTLQGKIWTGLENNALKKTIENRPKPVKGPQLKLF